MKHPIRHLSTVLGALAIVVAAAVVVPATLIAARSTAPEGLEAHPAMQQMQHTAMQHAAMQHDSHAAAAVTQVLAAIVAVDIVDDAFRPASISVPAGTTVTWTNRGGSSHTVTGTGFDSVMTRPGATFSFTFATAGTFRYVCSFHSGMSGTVVVTAGTAATPPPATVPPTTIGGTTVNMGDNYFSPRSLTVAAGSAVTWVNRGNNQHTVTTNDALFHSGLLAPGQTFSYTFNTPGTYLYLCAIHPSMTATITVTGTAVVAPTPAPAPSPATAGAIELRDNFFSPATYTVAAGTPVTWVNRGAVRHTVTSTTFDSGLIASGGTFSFTFATPGTYQYQCDLHTGMTGTVVVTGNAVPGPTPAPVAAPVRGPTAPAPATGGVTTVVIGENNFTPGVTSVAAGSTVVWENHGLVKHTVTSSGPTAFDSGLLSRDGRFSVTFPEPGSYPYICELHPGMSGTIDVVGSSGSTPGAAGPLIAPAPAVAPSPTPAAVAALPGDTAQVMIVDNAFDAPKISVSAGTTVTWMNHGQAKHNVIFATGGPNSEPLGSGQTFSRRFDLPGTYSYICALHAAMGGTVLVTAPAVAVVSTQTTGVPTTNKTSTADPGWIPLMLGLVLGGLFAITVGGLLGVRLLTRD